MQINCPPGIQLSAFLRSAGYSLPTFCGGRGNCGKCKVKVIPQICFITIQSPLRMIKPWISGIKCRAGVALHFRCFIIFLLFFLTEECSRKDGIFLHS
ncbi:MAG: 2Fe-2S iron-sulfur cluster binding domain-containing protein [Lachnospiraceae bacterium]|nr:2Fe-2S iron-sulfur cluster binding domain-containing protein [Lachnospiraceae bacterium]